VNHCAGWFNGWVVGQWVGGAMPMPHCCVLFYL